MLLAASATELTTAFTDALLAFECLVVLLCLRQAGAGEPVRHRLWRGIFGLMAVAAALGAVAHGLQLPAAVTAVLWNVLYLALGVLVALVGVAALHDWRGPAFALRLVPAAVALGAVFCGVTALFEGAFIVFVIYEAAVLSGAMALYVGLAATQRRRGAGIVAAGILLNLVAAAVQASSLSLTLLVPLDHNGLFHLVQMLATVVLAFGVVQGMPGAAPAPRR